MALTKRGGFKEGGGRPSPWGKNISTKQIRVPADCADFVLKLAALIYAQSKMETSSISAIEFAWGERKVFQILSLEPICPQDIKQLGYKVVENLSAANNVLIS